MRKTHRIFFAATLALTLAGTAPAFAYDPVGDVSSPGQTAAPGQPFAHPADDRSYAWDLREDEGRAAAQTPDQVEVRYISGGVGDDDFEKIESEQNDYDLKLLFAAGGAYLANVDVQIMDARDQDILETRTEGPVLLVQIPRGHYRVKATTETGETLSQRITVSDIHRASYVLHYPSIEK